MSNDIVAVIVFILGLTLLVFGIGIGLDSFAVAKSCRQLESSTGRYTEWTFWNGCLVEVNGKLVPQDNWRGEYDQ